MTRQMPVPKGTALAKFEGRIFFSNTDVKFEYFMESPTLTLGRSDPLSVLQEPLIPAQEGIDVGLGDSNKLSRKHARIEFDRTTQSFLLYCLGKNGLTVTNPSSLETVIMTPETTPVPLESRTLIQMGDCIFVFLLPAEYPTPPKKRREWIKAEYVSLRTLMMRLGYGRWERIIQSTTGRLSEREPEELIPVARKFVARCFIHARPGVEQKVLSEILREDVPQGATEEEAKADVDALVEEAKELAEPNEKRKYVRWARKLRLLRRLRDIHDHSSLDRLRGGQLRVFTPPPAPYWKSADDADLILGTFKHGYGATEAIRLDEALGFSHRYSAPLSTGKKGASQDKNVKARPSVGGNGEDDDDHDEEEDGDEEEYEGDHDATVDGSALKPKKEDTPMDMDVNSNSENGDANGREASESPQSQAPVNNEHVIPNQEQEGIAKEASPSDGASNIELAVDDSRSDTDGAKIQNGTPRKISAEGTNSDEAARLAAHAAAGEDGLVPFPSSESLMRRLKSIIHACAKEFERDQREMRKQTQAQSRAQRRRDDLAQRKAEKMAEKVRQREERRIAKSQPFSKKDSVEFERGLSNFGLDYKEDGTTVDWESFVTKVPSLRTKYVETLDDAYAEFSREAHRLVEVAAAQEDEDEERLEELKKEVPSTLFTQLTLDRAERVIDRLRFFRILRSEVLDFPELSSILRGMKRTKELPIWWRSSHDRALLWGVNLYGFNNFDAIATDSDLAFFKSMEAYNRKYAGEPKQLKKGVFPKASSLIKRAQALVVYFRSKAADPHYQQLVRETNANGSDDKEGTSHRGSNGRSREMSNGRRDSDYSGSREKAGSGMSAGGGQGLIAKRESWQEENSTMVRSKGESSTKRPTILNITDEDGNLKLPAALSDGLVLLDLGSIVSEPNTFHTEKTLYPVGFRTVRRMPSHDYLCEIIDDESKPMFRVCLLRGFDANRDFAQEDELWDAAEVVSCGSSIGAVWLKAVNDYEQSQSTGVDLASGAERFGLYEPTIIHHMQQLPGARQCEKYLFRDFSTQGAGAVVLPPVGILAAMTDALHIAKKRNAESLGDDEMDIPDEFKDFARPSAHGGSSKRKRRKSSSYWIEER